MRFRTAVVLPVLLVLAVNALAQKKTAPAPLPPASNGNEIAPPFSLMWHEPSERLEGKVLAARLNIVERRKVGGRWSVTVTGFKKPDPNDKTAPKPPELKRVVFYFVGGQLGKDKGKEQLAEGQLVEVELQYAQDGWDEEHYATCIGEKRQMLERLYGPGQQLVRTTTPTDDGKARKTLVGYKWNKNNTAVELIYFNVSDNEGKQQFHTLSLHYKRS